LYLNDSDEIGVRPEWEGAAARISVRSINVLIIGKWFPADRPENICSNKMKAEGSAHERSTER
jgi:hypothetical protein